METPFEGGCVPIWGAGEILTDQQLAACLGRMGRMGRMFLAYACARAIPGFGGPLHQRWGQSSFYTLPEKVPPYPPYPPFSKGKSLKGLRNVCRLIAGTSSLSLHSILPILPVLSATHQELVGMAATPTKSSERAMP